MGRGGPGGPRWGHQLGLRLRQNKQAGGVYKVREAAKKNSSLNVFLKKVPKFVFSFNGWHFTPPPLS